jgi:hypothetical protein
MHWPRWILIATSALAALTGAGVAAADPREDEASVVAWPGRAGRLAELQGTVWVYDPDAAQWSSAERNRPLSAGDRVWVDPDARANIRVGSISLLLTGNTELLLSRLDDAQMQFELLHGSMAAHLPIDDQARQVVVLTGEGRFQPLAAGRYRFDREGDVTHAAAWTGTLWLAGGESPLQIDAGRRIEVWRDARGDARTAASSWPGDRLSAWSDAAARAAPPEAFRHVSPEMTGAEDLDRYGSWDSHPEYGSVWMPYRVEPGWAPYQAGRWVWVRPWGWTWVDAAPWGFAPSHYGRWLQWRGRWCWWPGARHVRPLYAPALVSWRGGSVVQLTLTIGGPPRGSWVPLSPRQRYEPVVLPAPHHHGPATRDPWGRPSSQVPAGPISYGDKGVPTGVTIVPARRHRDPDVGPSPTVPQRGRPPQARVTGPEARSDAAARPDRRATPVPDSHRWTSSAEPDPIDLRRRDTQVHLPRAQAPSAAAPDSRRSSDNRKAPDDRNAQDDRKARDKGDDARRRAQVR